MNGQIKNNGFGAIEVFWFGWATDVWQCVLELLQNKKKITELWDGGNNLRNSEIKVVNLYLKKKKNLQNYWDNKAKT